MLEEPPISGNIITNAIQKLEEQHQAFGLALVDYLEKRDNVLDDKRAYWLQDLESELAEGFGQDTAKLIVKRLRRAVSMPDRSVRRI
jgi:peptide subunit release factor 1 (eRF1)